MVPRCRSTSSPSVSVPGAADDFGPGLGPVDGLRRSTGRSARPISASTRSSTARCSAFRSRSSTPSGARNWSRSPTNMPNRRGSRCAMSAATASIRSRRKKRTAACGEDESQRLSDQIQKLTDQTIGEIDQLLATKEVGDHSRSDRCGAENRDDVPCQPAPGGHRILTRPGSAACRDHHGRQRPLGGAARPAAEHGPSRRRRGGAPDGDDAALDAGVG